MNKILEEIVKNGPKVKAEHEAALSAQRRDQICKLKERLDGALKEVKLHKGRVTQLLKSIESKDKTITELANIVDEFRLIHEEAPKLVERANKAINKKAVSSVAWPPRVVRRVTNA